MSTGPIEFLHDEPIKDLYTTEFGGDPGLIQPEEKAGIDPALVGHELTPSEIRGAVDRIVRVPLNSHEQWTGETDVETLVDPVSGREVDQGELKDVSETGGNPSELKPK